ncbi:neuroblast differentiation-associated protein AHNAK isoform X24 [Etheostoma spectabile]|uniref:neuroblast differentiation-associated protein AHNAK isoform X24 n=1 Tax=Etheostoma spectabile TaxID=54343 RepID=UPI0013AF4C83|nr:neuroblast differentiation-associated protein AHNAK-like isoform X24 [Etheostoma spectabile]
MCECLRGIFRVTWTPSSNTDSDRDQEDSHVYSQTRAPAVKDKRRSPPSNRSPSAPQRNPHHSGSTDEQESPERVVQKEKLHAELKQVLSQKRSHLRESTCQLAQPEMDSEPTDRQTCAEDTSQSVEIVVEAEAGASGYSVTGGGQRGIFVKDVLRDSPAAKHLSLQEGDQLLSAKVYFDNVKYEDALKILQCAEPYKVSFQLKRSVPGVEVCLRPRVPSVEVKGPKAKTAKMSVKGSKVFKAKKKRGGRFGLKRLKEKRREEMVIEGTPPRMEMSDVDVEFSLPKFKQKRSMKVEAEGARGAAAVGKAKRRIRFPHLKTKGYTGEDAGGKVETGRLEGQVNISSPVIPEAKVKTKGKGHKFGITFPRTKHTKSGLASETGSVELKPPSVTIQQPSVEFNLSGDKKVDVEKGGVKRNAPDVEFALPSGKAEASLPAVKGKAEIKVPKVNIKGGVDAGAAVGRADVDIGKGDAKLRMPKLKLPKVRLSRHSDEIDGDIKVKAKGIKVPHTDIIPSKVEIKGGGEINLPEANITKPKMEGDLSGKAASIQMPSVDISFPKVKGKSDMDVSIPEYEGAGKTAIKMPGIDISVPDVDFKLDTKHRIPDEVEGTFKGPKISMPKIDMSLPKMGSSNVDIEGLEGGGKFSLPSVDISPPKVKTEVGDVDMHYYVGGDGKFKMPEFDISLPKCMPPEGEVNIKGEGFKLPKVDLTLPKGKAGTTDIEGVEKFKLPSFDISLPKMKTGEVAVDIEGPEVKGGKFEMPTLDISLPKGKMEGDIDVEGYTGKGGKFKMPTFDVTLPTLKQPEGHMNIETPKLEGEGKIKMPSLDLSMPKGKLEGDIEIEGPSAKGGKFKMPSLDVRLSKMGTTGAKVDLQGPEIKGGKTEMPSIDISLPKGKSKGEVDIEGKGGKFKMPSCNINLPKMKLSEGEVVLEGPDIKGGKIEMPTVDISVPQGKVEGDLDIGCSKVKGGKFNMPSLDISLPKIKLPEGDMKLECPEIPNVDFSLPKANVEGNIELEGSVISGDRFKMPTFDISFPKRKTKEGEVDIEGPEVKGGTKFNMPSLSDISPPAMQSPSVDISIPKGKVEGDIETKGKRGHFHIPSIDVSLPEIKSKRGDINIEGPEIKGGGIKMPTIDISTPQGSLEGDITVEGEGKEGKFSLPSVDITLPAVKFPEGDVNFQGPKVKGWKYEMPKVDLSLPKGKAQGDIDIDIRSGKDGNIEIPSYHTGLPKGKFKGPEFKGGQIHMPDIDLSLPKGKADLSVEGSDEKGGKLKKPKFDASLPKINLPEGNVKLEGPGIKGKMEKPTVDISLPKGKLAGDVDIDGHGVKGGKFHMPSLDISIPKIKAKGVEVKGDMSLPNIKSPEVDFSLEGPDVKGGTFNLPTVAISLPKGKAEGLDVEGPEVKGGEFKIPKCEVSLPKVSLAEGDVKIKSPEIKGGKIEMQDINMSLPKGQAGGEIEIEGHAGKGGKFHIPSVDISLPKMKAKGPEINIVGPKVKGGKLNMPSLDVSLPKVNSPDVDASLEGPDVKGGKVNIPTVDILLPKGKVEGDINVESLEVKGGKFKMPKFDVSLPKVDANVEGPDMKERNEMPTLNISLPKGKADEDIDIDGYNVKGSKYHMPSLDLSLAKMKAKGVEVDIEGPDLKGNITLPKGKVEGDLEIEGPEVKGGTFKMPTFDIALPKGNLPEGDVKIKGPGIKGGKIEMPDIDLSLPKGKAKGKIDIEGHAGKRGKFHMPSVDISLPKLKAKGVDVNIEGPELKGGKVNMPNIDLSLPKGNADLSIEDPEVKGGKFKMPKFDVSLPQMNLVEGNVKVEGPEMKGREIAMPAVNISVPVGKVEGDINIEGPSGKGKIEVAKVDLSGKKGGGIHMPTLDINLPEFDLDLSLPSGLKDQSLKVDTSGPEASGDLKMSGLKQDINPANLKVKGVDIETGGTEGPGASLKLPNVKLPTVDISAPRVDLDFGLTKPKGDDVEVELLKAEGGRPSSGGSFDLPNVSLKVPSFSLPRFGGKSKSGDFMISGPKGEVSLSAPHVEGEIRAPSVEFDGDGKVKVKKPKIKMPSFGISKKHADVSVSCPDVDVKVKKGEIGISKPEVNVGSPDDKLKYKVKFPKFKMSSPKGPLSEGEVDAKLEGNVEGKGGFHAPDVTIKLPKFSMAGFGSKEKELGKPSGYLESKAKVKMPSVELSLPAAKTPDNEVLLPKAEVDVSEADIKGYEGNLKIPKMPTIDVSIPIIDLDVSLPKVKHDAKVDEQGGKFKMPDIKMPDIDFSFPKGKTGEIEGGHIGVDAEGGKLKMPHVKMPDVDISLPKGKIKGPEMEIKGEGGKFKMPHMKMPNIDISLPKGKIEGPEMEIKGEGGKFKMPHLSMPSVDISLPKGKIEGPDIEMVGSTGGKFKMPHMKMPDVDISLPKGKIEGPDIEIEGGTGGKFKMPHMKMPNIDVSHPKGKIEVPHVEMEGGAEGKFKLPHWKMPDFDISLPKGKIEGPDVEIEGGTMPTVDISLPKGKTGGPKVETKGEGGKFKMPKVGISLPKGKPSIEGPEIDIKGDGGHFKTTNVGISIPKGKESIDIPEEKMAADGGTILLPDVKMPKVDISLPKGKSKDIEATAIEMEVTGGKFVGPHVKLPKGGISVLKDKSGEAEINLPTAEAGGTVKVPQVSSIDLDMDVRLDKPKQDTEAHGEADLHVKGEHKGLKLKMPTIDIKGPKGDLELDIGLHRGEDNKDRKKIELPDLDLNTTGTNSKVKGPKVKGTKFKIGMPKKKTGRDVTAEAKICKICGDEESGGKAKHRCRGKERFEYDVKFKTQNGHKENKDRINIPVPEVTLPTKQGSAELETGGEGSLSSSRGDSKVPRIPDIDFDIATSPDEDEDTTEKGKNIKIPKFGVALPSMSSPEGKINIFGPEIQYEGPKMPKVKKAVFVLVNPPQTGEHAACTGLQEKVTTPEAKKEDIKVKMPKIKMKPSFGKPKDNAAALSFSPGKTGSLDVNLRGKGSTSSLNGEKDASPHKASNDAKGTSSGKIKFPKVELTSPYGKMAAEGEDTEMSLKLGKDSSPGEVEGDTKGLQVQSGKMAVAGFSEELSKDVVSSRARTDMLDRDSSESPASFTMEFSSAKVQSWSKVESHSRESEERESSPWFKVPKFTLKPHSTGFLQITPEGSPQAQRKGEVGGEADVLGSFCLHTSGLDFTTQDVSEENQVCSTEDGTVTMVTKTTRITRHMVTSEARTGESSATTTTTHQVSDFKH